MNPARTAELPTYAVLTACYIALALAGVFHAELGIAWFPITIYLIALHGSLQHEALHGHPTRNPIINEALVFPAVGLFIPYRRFKRLHLRHHHDENLTDPFDDPESWYVTEREWMSAGPFHRAILRVNQTLLGRILIGPALSIHALYASDMRAIMDKNREVSLAYALHIPAVAIAVAFFVRVAGVSIVSLFGAAYLGMSLLMIRTFAEHQAATDVGARTAIVEAEAPFALLFLNNNLHAVHHENPRTPWYELPRLYRNQHQAVLERNGGYRFNGYRQMFSRHLLKAKEPIAHPFLRRK